MNDAAAVLVAADRAVRLAAKPTDDHLLLRLRLALHLPRLVHTDLDKDEIILAEAHRLLEGIRTDQAGLNWRDRATPTALTSLRLVPIPDETAYAIHERFHYIGSRRQGLHLGLVPPDWTAGQPPAVLFTVSPLDLPHLNPLLSTSKHPLTTQVLSRSFSFRWVPKNAFSYAYGKLSRFLAGDLDLLFSYVNPNMGFSGASYLAAGWRDLAQEHSPSYLYLDRDYCTRRQLAELFGSWDPARLDASAQGRITRSKSRLGPLRLLASALTHEARQWLKSQEPVRVPHLS